MTGWYWEGPGLFQVPYLLASPKFFLFFQKSLNALHHILFKLLNQTASSIYIAVHQAHKQCPGPILTALHSKCKHFSRQETTAQQFIREAEPREWGKLR